MGRMNRVLSAAGFVAIAAAAVPSSVLAQQRAARVSAFRTVSNMGGAINGIVSDDRGGPLPGAMVSIIGATMAMTVTDVDGRFSLQRLPAGDYTLRAHLAGFAASRREHVRVGAAAPPSIACSSIASIRPSPRPAHGRPVTARPILAAGFGLPSIEMPDTEARPTRIIRTPSPRGGFAISRAASSRIRPTAVLAATTTVSPLPIRSSAARGRRRPRCRILFRRPAVHRRGESPHDRRLRPRAGFLRGHASARRGVSRHRRADARRRLGSAGRDERRRSVLLDRRGFVRVQARGHALVRSRVVVQHAGIPGRKSARARGGERRKPERRRGVCDRSLDRRSRRDVRYGGRYARYDYLAQPGVFSPRAALTLEPSKRTRVTAVLAQRMIAPGAEEFLAPAVAGPWLPPERTFSPLDGQRPARGAGTLPRRSLRTRFRRRTYSVGVRRFFQGVDNQVMTIFGMRAPSGVRSVGHYYVATAGSVDAQGWGVRLSSSGSKRLSGSVDYTLSHGRWNSFGDLGQARPWIARLTRAQDEDIHDLTTSIRTDIPETATRVFVLYKLNSGYARRSGGFRNRPRWTLRCAGQPGAAVRPRGHEMGSAVWRAQPVSRSKRPGIHVRRAARRPPAQARRRRIPGEVLGASYRVFQVLHGPSGFLLVLVHDSLDRKASIRFFEGTSTVLERRGQIGR